ncbi:pyridoxamine 5'-phosphate oxidase family protein [Cohnella terricola]|nr:pyridoxamine 5'-phosphate oxidase family protein [Cohnella terricola]
MYPMRMFKLECKDQDRIHTFLEQARTGFLGLSADDSPYVVPLNYVWSKGFVYFHGASEGRKVDAMRRNTRACFSVCEDLGTISAVVPAHTDTAYMSVMVFGNVEPVSDPREATEAMQSMLDKYVPGYYDQPLSQSHVEKYISSLGSKTSVFKLVPNSITAKMNETPEESRLFYPGKTLRDERA